MVDNEAGRKPVQVYGRAENLMDSNQQPLMVPSPRGTQADAARVLTVGVEEEFFLVDRSTRKTVPHAPIMLAETADQLPGLQPEFTQFQVEICTPVCNTMSEVHAALRSSRATLNSAASEHGFALMASGTPVLRSSTEPPPLTNRQRYQQLNQTYGALTNEMFICGCHIHVGISNVHDKIKVSNYLRAWVPALLSLGTNSPFSYGRDTDYASWRYLVWAQWPNAGPPPVFSSVQEYNRELNAQLDAGAAMDSETNYWDIRLSRRHPTIEIRICDVLPTVDETVLIAALTRALVATALSDDHQPSPLSQSALRASSWRSARDGLEGLAINPVDGQLIPAALLAKQLIKLVQPALENSGDLELVTQSVDALINKGSGARRQREAYARNTDYTDVVDLLIAQTAGEIGLL